MLGAVHKNRSEGKNSDTVDLDHISTCTDRAYSSASSSILICGPPFILSSVDIRCTCPYCPIPRPLSADAFEEATVVSRSRASNFAPRNGVAPCFKGERGLPPLPLLVTFALGQRPLEDRVQSEHRRPTGRHIVCRLRQLTGV